jgi:ABC-type glycerol-3-phosphate transport system substrate-binding protein
LKKCKAMRMMAMLMCALLLSGASPVWAAEKITLGTFSTATSWNEAWAPRVQYCITNTNIDVEYFYIPHGTYSEKVLLMAAVGDMPYLLLVPPERVASLVSAGLVEDLEPWIEKSGIDQRYWFPSLIAANKFMGITLGLPAFVINYTYGYNKDIFAQNGITPPKITDWMSWEQVRTIAKKATLDTNGDGTPEIWGFHNNPVFVQVLAFIRQAGGEVYTDDGYVQFTSRPVRDGVEYQLGLINDKLNAPSANLFLDGKVASLRFGSGGNTYKQKDERGLSMGAAAGIMGEVKSDVSYVTPWVMPVASKQKDAAWRFMSCMVSREAQQLVANNGTVPMRRDVRIPDDRAELMSGLINNLEGSVGYPYHIENEFVVKAFDTAMKPVFAGQASPLSVLESLDLSINAYLAEKLK